MLPRTIIIVFSLLLSSVSFAQSSVIQQRLLATTQRVSDSIYRNINYVDAERARMITQKLEEAEALLSGGGGGGRPAPYPGDSYPPGNYQQLVSGRAGNKTFSFQAATLNEVFQKCATALASEQLVSIVEVSLDYGPKKSATTTSWWNSAGAMCVQVTKLASELGMRSEGGLAFAGEIDKRAFYFSGYSMADLGQQCENFVRKANVQLVSSINVTDFRVFKTLSTSNWWRTSYEICQQVFNVQ